MDFAKLVNILEDSRHEGLSFKFTDLNTAYEIKLLSLGVRSEGTIHSIWFKERLLQSVDDMMETKKNNKDVTLDFKQNIDAAFHYVNGGNISKDEIDVLARVSRILCRNLFDKTFEFSETFNRTSQHDSVSLEQLTFVWMMLHGPSVEQYTAVSDCLTIAQLMKYNSVKRRRSDDTAENAGGTRRISSQETPLSIYIAFLLYKECRGKRLI